MTGFIEIQVILIKIKWLRTLQFFNGSFTAVNCLHISLKEDKIHIITGVLNTPDLQIYLGLMVGIWASLGLDFVYLSIKLLCFQPFCE